MPDALEEAWVALLPKQRLASKLRDEVQRLVELDDKIHYQRAAALEAELKKLEVDQGVGKIAEIMGVLDRSPGLHKEVQERLVYDTENYCDEKVIRHLKAD